MVGQTTVRTPLGAVRGETRDGIAAFRGIPYAAPPVGPLRFQPPAPVEPWPDVLDVTDAHVAAPQNEPTINAQSEDCLVLSVFTPDVAPATPLPVFFWVHGSGARFGSGGYPGFDGSALARTGPMVVVTINYRLGLLGFLHAPALFPDTFASGNLSLHDQLAALGWVRDNIAAFGGDPGQVTIAGQSAGGCAVAGLMATQRSEGLFHRGILQSGALRRPHSVADAGTVARAAVDLLDEPVATAEDLQRVPVASLLRAQKRLLETHLGFAEYYPPFQWVDDDELVTGSWIRAIADGWAGRQVDLMTGATKDDGKAAIAFQPGYEDLTFDQVVARLEPSLGDRAAAVVAVYRGVRPAETPAELIGTILVERDSRVPGRRIADELVARGRRVYLYEFEWESRIRALGAVHGIEVPFIFANFDRWTDDPILEGADRREVDAIAEHVHRAWAGFVTTGDPNHAGMVAWRPYDSHTRPTMRFGPITDCVDDLSGRTSDVLDAALPPNWP